MTLASSSATRSLEVIAGRFHPPDQIDAIDAIGSGNVNDTFLVRLARESNPDAFVMQRINTQVFTRPDLVMGNLIALGRHVQRRIASGLPELDGRRWEVPRVLSTLSEDRHWVEHEGQFWRSISYIGAATAHDVVSDCAHAREVGYGLGMFHHLISDLPVEALADTLEGFHVTPAYLKRYDCVLSAWPGAHCAVDGDVDVDASRLSEAFAYVAQGRAGADVLEAACSRGELQRRPIHGDPKINNVMIDESSGQAVGLIDLDTVKPGLVHYDIGDCLRSCCNPVGEEVSDLSKVRFDLGLCRSILEGYFSVARAFLSSADLAYLPACIRLIPFELGLRFLTDHLEGDRYFKVERRGQNLDRALVQFALMRSIENQFEAIEALVVELTSTT
ncbi:MAG: aminoglycoside phosphotransferase [Synechococcus sp. NAT40]|nr:aminoglycoside phosphotransferase [Synechococcus sp. NAT40]